jgi:hypothetical protein
MQLHDLATQFLLSLDKKLTKMSTAGPASVVLSERPAAGGFEPEDDSLNPEWRWWG